MPLSPLSLALLLAGPVRADDALDDPLFEDEGPPVGSVRRARAFGLGVGAGTSTAGLSLKYWTSEAFALQAVVGAGYRRREPERDLVEDEGGWAAGPALSMDALFEQPSFAELDGVELGWSLGPGLGLWMDDETALAVSGVAGLELGVLAAPIDAVLEYRPRVVVYPSLGFDWFSLSGHLRWYFGKRRS